MSGPTLDRRTLAQGVAAAAALGAIPNAAGAADASANFTIAELSALYRARKLSPVEVTKARLARIAAVDSRLHGFIRLTEERALADAARAETAFMRGGSVSPLTGVPVGLKDIIDTGGIVSTSGSRVRIDHVPDADATCAARLKTAGSVLMGKLNTLEFAGGSTGLDLPFPPARNPWDLTRSPGGSSSGPGASVAAGLVAGALGSDTGGSIRMPASYCGIAGLKPTYGLVSRAGVSPAAFSMDHVGPLAWTVEDCAILLQAIAGPDPRDPTAVARRPVDYRRDIGRGVKGLRIGVIRRFHERDARVSDATRAGVENAIAVYRSLGAEIREVDLSPLDEWNACSIPITLAERGAAYEHLVRTRLNDFGKSLRERLITACLVSGVDYVQAQRRRQELCAEMKAAFAGVDIMLTASTPGEAPPFDAPPPPPADGPRMPASSTGGGNLTLPFNISGYPAISICSGYSPAGLPTSIQLAAKPFREALLLRTANAYEKATSWRSSRPRL